MLSMQLALDAPRRTSDEVSSTSGVTFISTSEA
jgi:hypothetical protein